MVEYTLMKQKKQKVGYDIWPTYRAKIAELFADGGCSQAILASVLVIQRITDVGRTAGPPVAEDAGAAASEASEWDSRELAALREEEERLGEEIRK